MRETIDRVKTTDEPFRLEYGAVPLDPWNATEPDSLKEYTLASLDRIETKLQTAMNGAVERGWVEPSMHALELYDFMLRSLHDSQMRRIDLNYAIELEKVALTPGDERIARAKEGIATPSDLFGLLMQYPDLHSIELAKLSHPLDVNATYEMDIDVYDTILKECDTLSLEPPTHKLKQCDPDTPAAIILRKQPMAIKRTSHGIIEVVQRKSFLIRADSDATPDEQLMRKVENLKRFPELIRKMEAYLNDLDEHPDRLWIQPQATSYYAKYLSAKEVRKYDR